MTEDVAVATSDMEANSPTAAAATSPHPLCPLPMPNPSRSGRAEVVHTGSVVIVGANGSGKSRLGTWIESPMAIFRPNGHLHTNDKSPRRAYRISAQRQLALPDEALRVSLEVAEQQLERGGEHAGGGPSRINYIDPAVGSLDDFRPLLNALFARRAETDRVIGSRVRTGTLGAGERPDEDPLAKLERVWSAIFSERELRLGNHKVLAAAHGSNVEYSASRMSDGERAGFYLIAQTLLAPQSTTLVLDEPELHLHRSIQSRIWDALEAERPDCTFIYITHDLEFASGRYSAAKVVVYDYSPPTPESEAGSWDWEPLPKDHGVPEDVVLRILGSRRPTLFVEGKRGSRDIKVYEVLFPDHHVIPSGGCSEVRRATQSFSEHFSQHHMLPRGIVDRDDLEDAEISSLEKANVYALPVAGVENLLLLPECIAAYVRRWITNTQDAEQALLKACQLAVIAMERVRADTVKKRAQHAVRHRLEQVNAKGSSRDDLIAAVEDRVSSVDAGARYDAAELTINAALASANRDGIESLLIVFRNKALLSEVASALRIGTDTYQERVLELLRTDSELATSVRMRFSLK